MALIDELEDEAYQYAKENGSVGNFYQMKLDKLLELIMNEVNDILPDECYYKEEIKFSNWHCMNVIRDRFSLDFSNKQRRFTDQ